MECKIHPSTDEKELEDRRGEMVQLAADAEELGG